MRKRNFEDDEDEDYQDGGQPLDDKPEPSPRVTRYNLRVTTSGPQNRNNEQAQEETNDATFEDNTTVSDDYPYGSNTVSGGRVRISGPTRCCGVVTPSIRVPQSAKRIVGEFQCPICLSRFTRSEGVNFHFAACAEKHGNPHGHRWNDHLSCASRSSGQPGVAADPRHQVRPPAPKKRCIVSLSSGPSTATRSGNDEIAQTRPVSPPDALLTAPRATRSKPMQRASGTRPGPGLGISKTRSKETRGASRTSAARPKAGKEKNSNDNRKSKTPRKSVSGVGERTTVYRSHIDESLPPLSDLDAIFHDMVSKAWEKTPLAEAMKTLSEKKIHVATMCSGTESPLLALGKIQNSLKLSGKPTLNIKHLFSAEIVPYKQAYIERNFGPDVLFRDIREIAAGGQATTAYGALTDVPSDVDILVAGFSCVDFSHLNKRGKKLMDIGESGDTFRAILQYAKKYRPAVIILENVEGAPWDLIKAIWENDREFVQKYFKKVKDGEDDAEHGPDTFWDDDDPAYSATFHRVDAKNYYVPQTRTRRYMVCLNRLLFPSLELADQAALAWARHMVALERKASVSVEAFLLPEDDPRLQRAKDQFSKTGKPRRDTNWEICNGRYEDYRLKEKLGISRPITEWTNDGSAKASSYLWTDWTLSQVERIWDTIDISYLRNAARGFDSFHKQRFWELSQNIDRYEDNTPAGVVSCLTPTGQPFSTMRGGPVTGLEAVALQGLPIDVLLLTRESERELFDLAGNAMTSTVVGAALLSVLAVSHSILSRPKDSNYGALNLSSSQTKEMRDTELEKKRVLKFDGVQESSLDGLCKMARASIRLCHCEGQSLTALTPIRMCKCCHHYCCEKCGNKPKHDYELVGGNGAPLRTEPQELRRRVSSDLPTRLKIDGLDSEMLENFAQFLPELSEPDWRLFREAILLASKQEYRYESAKRSHRWTVTYNAMTSRLELVFDQDEVYWLLYGKPGQLETGDSPVRKLLELPLARLTVRGKNMRGDHMSGDKLLEGSWEIRLPMSHTFSITVTPRGGLTDSWEKKLGLQGGKYIDKQVYKCLSVGCTVETAGLVLDHEICGDYDLLENCGTACSSLHKKRPTANAPGTPSLFLFLDSDRIGPPKDDCYVFSTEIQRLDYGESRYVAAKVNSNWRPPYQGPLPQADGTVTSEAECTVSSRWESCPLVLRPHKDLDEAYSKFPKGELFMPIFPNRLPQYADNDRYGCLHESATTTLLSCEIPGQMADSVGWEVGRWTIIDQKSERQVAAWFAWLFSRVKHLGKFKDRWRYLGHLPSDYQQCMTCVPESPAIMWTCSRGAKKTKIIPYEDGRDAGEFERRIKARPAPFLVQTCIDTDEKHTGRLLVGLNVPTLVHRALARLDDVQSGDDVEISWSLNTRFEAPTRYKLRSFTLPSNKSTPQAQYEFPTGQQLRSEQKRSLHWMIGQEADDKTFYEEEIEEATLSQLNWRAEARVRRTGIFRGGVLADEVGYGKTATTLALVDAQEQKAKEYARNQGPGCIPVQGTLVLVPPHLVHQWTGQALKFLGISVDTDKILVIENVMRLEKISVQQIKQAVIIIVSWQVLISPTYMVRLSHFAALPEGPTNGEREIDAWLTRACGNIEDHMEELASEKHNIKDFAAEMKLVLKAAHTDKEILRDVPTQRLKGAKYTTWNPTESVTPKDPSPKEEDLRKFFKNMTNASCTDLDSMTGILLHMFDFYRIVIDEYTYVDDDQKAGKISRIMNKIKARSRWVLSGTPRMQDFGEVRDLASFIGYNLGVVDDAAGVIKGAAIRRIREDRTAAEQFRAFGYSHTPAWHISRQAHAQFFLNKYASKNVAEIGLIESTVHLHPHLLGAAETILNAELQQQLQSTEMRIVLHGKGKKDNDRLRRYKELLKDCKSASECLLRSNAYFELEQTQSAGNELSGDATSFDASERLITIREGQMEELVAELEHNLLHAAWLEQQCQRATEPEHRGSHYLHWKSEIERAGLRDPTATDELRKYLSAAPENVGPDTEEMYYRDPPTAKELKQEKAAADKRVKQAKAKKEAEKKAKKASKSKQTQKSSRSSKAVAAPDEDYEEMDVSESESIQADGDDMDLDTPESIQTDDVDPDPPNLKPNKILKDDFKEYASVLRSLTGHLRSLATELVSRTRSLRFAFGSQELCQWCFDSDKAPICESCGMVARNLDEFSINVRCGHSTCSECIEKTNDVVCAFNGCGEGAESFRLRKPSDLVGDGKSWFHGAKVGHIITLINSLPKGEQVLLFVQFEDVMDNIASALEAADISNYVLRKKANPKEMVNMMIDFQDNQGQDKKRVLLLNPSSETAAGINLTNANHIIFASPLLTSTQQSYIASMTQCIGRAKRYGQQKTVHVYRFVALRTIDVDILQEREEKTLVMKKDVKGKAPERRPGLSQHTRGARTKAEKWFLVEEDEIDQTVEAGWGSGYDFKSNPDEEES